MTDYFTLLQQPHRPWLDLEELEQNYREMARSTHPDERARADGAAFAEANAAYRTLRDPKLRLQHLLALEGKPPAQSTVDIPVDLLDLFTKITPALGRNIKEEIDALIAQLGQRYDEALNQLRRLSGVWNDNEPRRLSDAERLYHRFAFLSRWKELLKEHRFSLSAENR